MKQREELAVTWQEGDADRSTDHFPLAFFANEGHFQKLKHLVTKGTWLNWAWFDLKVTSHVALLDYRPYGPLNDKNGMQLGRLRITFRDADRTKLNRYEWSTTGRFEEFRVTEVVPSPTTLPKYQPEPGRTKRAHRKVKVRPGQAKFKRSLLIAYGGKCCLTDCDVSESLEAAHIDWHQNTSYDHPCNGLLLRKDLHALFDEYLISINPATRVVSIAEEARSYPEYAALHDRRPICPPLKQFSEYKPDPGALQRHWEKYLKG